MKHSDVNVIVKEYKKGLKKILGNKLCTIILYGSMARGDYNENSDIDILCVLENSFDYQEMIKQTSECTANLSLKYDVVISRVFVSETEYSACNLPFFMNIRKEGVPV